MIKLNSSNVVPSGRIVNGRRTQLTNDDPEQSSLAPKCGDVEHSSSLEVAWGRVVGSCSNMEGKGTDSRPPGAYYRY